MKIVNETGQEVFYGISGGGSADCGTIAVDGFVDLPFYDNQAEVKVSVTHPVDRIFTITVPSSGTGEQVEMAVLAE
jgi:hypothetical protein